MSSIEKAWSFLKEEARLRGSTGAMLRTLPNGKRVVVKRGAFQSGNPEAHINNEYDMNRYLHELGVGVPDAQMTEEFGRPTMITDFEEGAKPILPHLDSSKLREDVVPHALIANWDVLGRELDNVLRRPDGSLTYVDVGGAGAFRAQGEPKGGRFGNTVSELDTFQEKMPYVYNNLSEEEIEQSYDKFGGVDAMQAATDVLRDSQTSNVLQERAQDLARRVGDV